MIVLKGEMKREERDSYGDGKSPPKEKVELLKETARVQSTDRAPEGTVLTSHLEIIRMWETGCYFG